MEQTHILDPDAVRLIADDLSLPVADALSDLIESHGDDLQTVWAMLAAGYVSGQYGDDVDEQVCKLLADLRHGEYFGDSAEPVSDDCDDKSGRYLSAFTSRMPLAYLAEAAWTVTTMAALRGQ